MTEADWLTATDPTPLLAFLRETGRLGERKARLFACACRTPAVLSLAQAAYDHRELPAGPLDPARLAELAGALEHAGCADAELLGHLRGDGPHVRGCWAVDAILGKA
jgi:hypothetical protein